MRSVLKGRAKSARWTSAKQSSEGMGLAGHFIKHGAEVGSSSKRAYNISSRITIQQGVRFKYRDPTTNAFRVGYWDMNTGLFTGTIENGKKTTILTHFPLSWEKIKSFPGFTFD